MICRPDRLTTVVGALALAGTLWTTAPAAAQTFTDVTAARGISFVGEEGDTLPMETDLSINLAIEAEIVQRTQGTGASVSDYDNDGDLDVLFLGQLGHTNVLYRNDLDTSGTFTDVTAAAGLINRGQSRVALFVDLDNDGWQDLVLANDRRCGNACPAPTGLSGIVAGGGGGVSGGSSAGTAGGALTASATMLDPMEMASKIYRNEGDGTFTDVTSGSGFYPSGYIVGGMGLVDYDRDGLLDIYVTTWGGLQANQGTLFEGHNRLYLNEGGFQFRDITRLTGLGKVESNSFTPIFADFDNDGDTDLYLAVDGFPDKFFRFAAGQYFEQGALIGANHVGTDMGIACGDYDQDGDLDLYVTNVTDPGGVWGGNTLLQNQREPLGVLNFVDMAVAEGVEDTAWGWGTEWVDVDNDADLDLFAVNGLEEFVTETGLPPGLNNRPAYLFFNDGSGGFTSSVGTGAEVVGDARVAIKFDMDRDGDQDLLITHMDAPPVLLENSLNDRGSPPNHWLTVKLVGAGTVNRDGVHSRIRLVVGSETYMHEVIGGGSYLAGRPFEAHFGLGRAATVDELHVDWPDGTSTMLTNVAADQYLTVTHP